MKGLELQLRVKDTRTGRVGTTCPDIMGTCSSAETPVFYDDGTMFEGTLTESLEVIGPENAVADESCGLGCGERCCVFVVADGQGLRCERFGPRRWTCMFADMAAKRQPNEPYPGCKLPTPPTS